MGYGPLTALRIPLFSLSRFHVNLWDILIFLLIMWLIDALPGPIRSIAAIGLLIWLLTFFGILAIPITSNIVVIAIIVGLAIYLITGR